ncbi:molybdenum cofactor biosynthesis protein MoaE [Agromyces sp. Soil535]|uniref:molybdenum cofactor biosynthesis protein MoaE n=1 Tax=Agromyces sp. Soil535 TaxID=1736390 RepID=UPI0006FD86EA|nr:molybdenum cofactor biosynthesis protein MoaE [Agromyces sp. Soil535]KRE23037.1 molybdenum cofactor biosynthesis protein MoaE [Agromyces sp. Soil535]
MPEPEVFALVTTAPLDRAAIEAFVQTPHDGALVTFEGVIRDHDHGASVTSLDYEAHPEAERFLRETCAKVARETGLRVAAAHRIGTLAIGDVALVASVAAPHRAEAFTACALLVDRIKERIPIWKRQHLEGGTTEWVNL